jgi:hypothetical protein
MALVQLAKVSATKEDTLKEQAIPGSLMLQEYSSSTNKRYRTVLK